MNAWIRQFHRWIAIVFTCGFITNAVVAFKGQQPTLLVGLFALLPLVLLLLTGLYLFALPYIVRRRAVAGQ